MTPEEFDAFAIWAPALRPPRDWDGVTPYLLRVGWVHLRGQELRAYQISDGTRILNIEDVTKVSQAVRD
ncbi:hypothetical protein [Limnoglobus roseus]|uniref:Uncharacterized protein n=1 Tax=Limnoglobus roseus TaxID=2598579 RepID=A0A5C1A8S1_9BACT|nr:hypothetical protein [Limnoglobus roseus]QEL14172.1 hypothetical protein PX52LOC_01042 [Limnoglobus roseus]